MKSLALLLCLAQLWGCHAAPHIPGLVYRELDCDDPETEQAALVAVDYINNHVLQGYKHTLNQIDKVKVWPRVSEPSVSEPKEPMCGAQLGVSKITSPNTMKLQRVKLSDFFSGVREGASGGARHSELWSWVSRGC